ncbi:hypothetical protein K458DRAFT_299763 [Lentithecium fluviatile CBS 122367]|uniref:Uncharacterized protein n=1 Tax=Lentithecium fluviatile CBS 122367 TaxID=1168545 RepID=A0A6G1J6G4_9PLEO|nr:hypothetical protein K458DRAFT_299763 [Lentithecium fluviatile CBS 122367]
MELPSGNVCPEEEHVPTEKSGVYVDPMAANQSGRFQKHDEVHMSIIEGGIRTKGTFTIAKGRLHSSCGYYEYQLYTASGGLHNGGQWVREKDLKRQSRS